MIIYSLIPTVFLKPICITESILGPNVKQLKRYHFIIFQKYPMTRHLLLARTYNIILRLDRRIACKENLI